MVSLRSQLVREISALYGFVDSISALCVHVPQSVAFTEPSATFFSHVEKLATSTKKHLSAFPVGEAESASEEAFHEMRDELRTIRSAWKEIHQFVKSAIDADTLNQPSALISFMLSRVRQLEGLATTDFAIFHTHTFNYLQVNPTSIRTTLRELVFLVEAEEFPVGLGLIGIPSTQGTSLLLNCLVAHEMGEYVYVEKSLDGRLQPEVEAALQIAQGAAYEKLDKTAKTLLIDTLLKWGKEVFCDPFAVRLVGPLGDAYQEPEWAGSVWAIAFHSSGGWGSGSVCRRLYTEMTLSPARLATPVQSFRHAGSEPWESELGGS
jgi:hypothetical protein